MAEDTQNMETLICECGKEFPLVPIEREFYKKNDLPNPAKCPECRQLDRMTLSRSRSLHKRACDKCKKEILSVYNEKDPYTVYCQQCYWDTLK